MGKRFLLLISIYAIIVCSACSKPSNDTSSDQSQTFDNSSMVSEHVSSELSSVESESLSETSEVDNESVFEVSSEGTSSYNPITGDPSKVVAVIPENLPVYEDGTIQLIPDGTTLPYSSLVLPENRKYRCVYYRFMDEWQYTLSSMRGWGDLLYSSAEIESFLETHSQMDGNSNEMLLVSMIKYFNITREEMEEIIEEQRLIFEDEYFDEWRDSEFCELPNLDIIYTLDNDIINEYYRYG